jgi:N-acetylmuramic acid 6-phosphate etherase
MAAMVRSSEALEDRADDGATAIIERQITSQDVVFGITAGGTTPFVHGALQEAQNRQAKTIFFACVPFEQVPARYDVEIRPLVGPEILAGSTRLKSGTATKLVLNTISTGVMVQLGKVYGNRMVDVAVTNSKLEDRAIRIIRDLAAVSRETAAGLLAASGKRVKVALLMHWTGCTADVALDLLQKTRGQLRAAREKFTANN